MHCHTSNQQFGSYAAWTQIKTLCENRKKIGVALELGSPLPDEQELARWLGEPIRAVVLNTDLFVMNADGYPVLKKRHQNFVIELAQFTTRLVMKGISKFEDGMLPYQLYLRNLLSLAPRLSEQEVAEMPYRDFLQSPLQPLADNLESATYETFERDPVKSALLACFDFFCCRHVCSSSSCFYFWCSSSIWCVGTLNMRRQSPWL